MFKNIPPILYLFEYLFVHDVLVKQDYCDYFHPLFNKLSWEIKTQPTKFHKYYNHKKFIQVLNNYNVRIFNEFVDQGNIVDRKIHDPQYAQYGELFALWIYRNYIHLNSIKLCLWPIISDYYKWYNKDDIEKAIKDSYDKYPI